MGWKWGLTGALALCASPAQAQQQLVLPEITVSATTVPTPQNEVASSVTVIPGKQIEQEQRRTLPDLLQAQPGLNVVQTGGPGGVTSVFIRGTNPNHVKVLLDGIDIGDPTNPTGAVDLGHVLTSNIGAVEILRGPQSGLYGANAIGGVITLSTKKGDGPAQATGMVEGGSFGTFNQTANLAGSLDRFNYSFNVTHFHASSTPVTPDYYLPPGQRRNNDFYDNVTYSTRFGVDFTPEFSVNFYGRLVDSSLKFTNDSFNLTTFLLEPNAQRTEQHTQQTYGRAEAVYSAFNGLFVNTVGYNYTYSTRNSDDPTLPPQVFTGTRRKFDWRGDVKFAPGQVLVLGLEREDESVTVPLTKASNGNQAGFAELQLSWLKNVFLVSNVRYDINDAFGGHMTWRVGPAVILPGTDTKLKATYGTGFKAPALLQLYGDDPVNLFVANPNLQPEESKGYDFGFEQPLFNNRAAFGVTYYHNEVRNLINFVQVSAAPLLFSLANVDRARMQGYEAFVAVTPFETLTLRGDYTLTDAINQTTGAELVRRPRNKWSATAVWRPLAGLSVTGSLVSVGKWQDFDRAGATLGTTAPGYTVVNVAANYQVDKNTMLYARIDNLFNEQYEDPLGWMRPGLGVYAGLKLNN